MVQDGIYFVPPGHLDGRFSIQFYDFAARDVVPITRLEKRPISPTWGLSVSPNGRSILYAQSDEVNQDLMLVENLRHRPRIGSAKRPLGKSAALPLSST